jgi:hypothetical protein
VKLQLRSLSPVVCSKQDESVDEMSANAIAK